MITIQVKILEYITLSPLFTTLLHRDYSDECICMVDIFILYTQFKAILARLKLDKSSLPVRNRFYAYILQSTRFLTLFVLISK